MTTFEAFPLYLKVSDIVDATQYHRSHVYVLIKELESKNIPGAVIRRGKKGIRVDRDKFFAWYTKREGISA